MTEKSQSFPQKIGSNINDLQEMVAMRNQSGSQVNDANEKEYVDTSVSFLKTHWNAIEFLLVV